MPVPPTTQDLTASAASPELLAPPAMISVTGTRRTHRVVCRAVSGFIFVITITVLAGWVGDVSVLRCLLPSGVAMNPVTAIALLAAAVALWLRVVTPASRYRLHVGDALAAVVLIVGAVRLGNSIGFPIRIDQLLFGGTLRGNSMAPNTATSFVMVGMSLLVIDRKVAGKRSAPFLALGTIAVSMLAMLGYLYQQESLYRIEGTMAMALNTAICFFLMGIGILSLRPEDPPVSTLLSKSVGGMVARRLLPAALLMPALIGYAAIEVGRSDDGGLFIAVLLFTLSTMVVFVALTAWTAGRLHKLDIDNRETLDRLQRAEAVYHSLVQTLPQNIFRKDLDGKFTFANRHFCGTLGRPLAQIVGKTDFDFYAGELAARYRHDDLEVARRGKTIDIVEEHVTPGGDRLYVQVIKTPVRGPDGEVIGVQGIFWDVTDRVVAQKGLEETNKMLVLANDELGRTNDELNHANARLEKSVAAERAAIEELTRTQTHLVQSEKMVGLGQMVAGVAHEINNPLAFVTNNVAVLQRDVRALAGLIDLYKQSDGDLKSSRPDLAAAIADASDAIDVDYTRKNLDDLLERSREGLRRIQQIVRDLRDFARLDQSDLQSVNLNDGIESTLNIILGHAKKKQIRFDKRLATDLPAVTCYPAKVNQVIMNLLSNAIDASNEGGRIGVRTLARLHVHGVQEVIIEVQDEGCGIDAELRRRIFDPFFTTKPIGQGTGLGLSISYGIIRDHGGTIELESEVGKGSLFRVALPVEPREA